MNWIKLLHQRRFFSSSCAKRASIKVSPKNSLADQRLTSIIISDVAPNSEVTLKLSVTNSVNLNFSSMAHFVSNDHGIVDLSKDLPRCGSYENPDLMSIFWQMTPQTDSDSRFWPIDVHQGLECNFEVFCGHIEKDEAHEQLTCAANQVLHRHYMAKDVKRVEIEGCNVKGTMFFPSGEGPFPAVINIYGGIHKGRVIEDKAAMFASRGIASLSLAFFGVPGLPKSYASQPLNLNYFEEALDHVIGYDQVDSTRGIGVVGISKGAEAALAMAAFMPKHKIGAVAVMNSILNHSVVPIEYNNQIVCEAWIPDIVPENLEYLEPTLICIRKMFQNVDSGPMIPFWHCEAPLLFLAGSDDRLQPSLEQAQIAEKILRESGKSNFGIQVFDGLGHLVDLPFSPPTTTTNHALFPKPNVLVMGGDQREKHGRAQEQIWHELLTFFKTNLGHQ